MHFRAAITFNKEHAKNFEEARMFAKTYLENEGFCTQGRFGSGPADWFVIGGRWSGDLVRSSLDKDKYERWIIDNNNLKRNEKEQQESFETLFPGVKYKVDRDSYDHMGEEDDAAIVTKQLFDAYLKEHQGVTEDGEHFWDLDYSDVDEETFIGKKWIVIVDYHS
jgi:hypothetical protein